MRSIRIDIDYSRSEVWGFGLAIVPSNGGVISLGRWYVELTWKRR